MKIPRARPRRWPRLVVGGIAVGLVISATALGTTAAQAAAPGTPQYCIETMTCTIADFNGMTMDQRLQFIRGLSDGPAQQFRSGFKYWRAIEGVIEFFNDRGLGKPGTWISYVDGGILQGTERGIAMAAGMDSAGDMGNQGADYWRTFLLDLQAGRLGDRISLDHEWGLAEQQSTDAGVNYAVGRASPSNLENNWFNWSQVFRYVMINEASIRNIPVLGGILGTILDKTNFTDVTSASNVYFWTSAAWNASAGLTLLNDITTQNWPQFALDMYNFLTTGCSSGCTGGGQNPPLLPSVYDVPGGGAFRALWNQLGGMNGLLGDPAGNWYGVTGGQSQNFAGATAYWGSSTGTHEIHGAIRDHYNALGGPNSVLGLPTSNEQNAPGGGRENTFAGSSCGSGSVMLWTPGTGAHEMHGCIYNAYLKTYGGPAGVTGYPVSDETNDPTGTGRVNYMSGSACGSVTGSAIYWNGAAHVVRGCSYQTYKANGETLHLGFPVADEYTDSNGWHQLFQNGRIDNGVVTYYPTCTNYGGPTITGPNACGGTFYTAPPPGKPASGNVWYSGHGTGLFGQEIWTYGNGTVATSTAVYNLSGLDTIRVMQLQAYIPNNYSDATNAHYHYCSPGGGCADGYINQNNYTNQWVTFGAVCTSDGTAQVVLADDGGDVYPAIVGADAIRAVRTSYVC